MSQRPKHDSLYYRARFEKLATKQRWPGHPEWENMKQGVISIRMRRAQELEGNALMYEAIDARKQQKVTRAGGPPIILADTSNINTIVTTTPKLAPNVSWADIE